MGSSCIKSKKSKKRSENNELLSNQPEENKSSKKSKRKGQKVHEPLAINDSEIIILDDNIQDFPEFYSTQSNIGVWSFSLESSDSQFPETVNQEIESAYLTGKSQFEVKIEENAFKIIFKDSVMSNSDSIYPVLRTELMTQNYGWQADDGTVRPFIKELADLLEVTGGELKCKIDGTPFSISLPKRQLIDLTTKIKRKIILL